MTYKVEMRPAYEWTCEDCGRDQFVSCIVLEMTPQERLEQAIFLGLCDESSTELPDFLFGEFVTYPDEVVCQFCRSKFETKHYSSEINESYKENKEDEE